MSTQLQFRKGNKIDNDAFTGAEGEMTYDTTTGGLRIHNGSTQGGYMVDPVVDFQTPSIENNYTWYRKYASGWVEQGGYIPSNTTSLVFPVTMADTNYCFSIGFIDSSTTQNPQWQEMGAKTIEQTISFALQSLNKQVLL